jgi:hypothetical protein
LDVEGAEVLAIRSATHLLAANRIKRVMLEVQPALWSKFGIRKEQGLLELRSHFAQWRCTVACNGALYAWDTTELPGGGCNYTRSPSSIGYNPPMDVYCVHL